MNCYFKYNFILKYKYVIAAIFLTLFVAQNSAVHSKAPVYTLGHTSITTKGFEAPQSPTNDQVTSEDDKDKQLEQLKVYTIVSLVVAFVVLMTLSIIIQSYRVLKKQYATIKKQQAEIEKTSEELAIQNDNLKELNREKNSVISYVSHDLMTPFGNIEGLVHLIELEEATLSDNQKSYLSTIKEVVENGKLTIHSMLNINKIEQEIKGVELNDENLYQILKEVVIGHQMLADEKNISLEIIAEDESVSASTDKQYCKQIFSNLVSNAIKFSEPETKVAISVIDKGETAVVEVRDEGPGLSDRDKDRIFLKYEQLSSRGEEGPSAGLGLPIVKQLVDKLNGKIRVESDLDKGSTFTVELLK